MVCRLEKNRVWRTYLGGKKIDAFDGAGEQQDGHFPEDWVASTTVANNYGREEQTEGLCLCKNGSALKEMIDSDPKKYLGQRQVEKHGEQMSILVKLLDSAERLVIQAHPTIEFAKRHFKSPRGKAECWYIINADEGACIYLGFKPGITEKQWTELFIRQDIEAMLKCLHKLPVTDGDVFFVDGGMPHAIGKGCMMVELQEATDLMVIPERITPGGIILSEEKMHGGIGFDNMFDCFDYTGYTLSELKSRYYRTFSAEPDSRCVLVGSDLTDKFRMEMYAVSNHLHIDYEDTYVVAIVLDGYGEVQAGQHHTEIKKGDRLFIPAYDSKVLWKGMDNLKIVACLP